MMLESIVADVNILYLSGADHHDISDNVIINSGILPQNFVRDNKIVSPAGMVFHLSSGSVSDPLNKQCWRISFVSSAELCPTLVNIHRSSNLIQVYLGGQHKLLNNYSTINQIVDACQHEKYTGSDGSQFVEMIWEIH
ncbi:hypothetical protein BL250_15005 [Erwinia sp. OLTSP20]|nr:hypothetical protein BV501_11715 [Erwinia sp. OAMSP11]PIJ70944.1 hypothetical protein BK416_12905 [Erwinia sp. OLSSP12]PIJ80310.1 hypothetical protein BLD47_11770 [Erwinia sp. OLCASP19]PIJ82434.1 hypothetical protein BLD46_11520 [Erwinia sp. OLMTSP26]PIJ85119.1 hypothetical protein BLD49_11630 [Erwinia sp. OLMDSP33]PIJ89158.1 hypothetical protein BL249_17430 [Erwinia sp. OLFS4]PIJ89835.1 hypothetical protein BL250_15005 [Erwinia sp. OLTSP20]